eukprot:365450-Chlamydomonas_euryale.AAC.5
MYERERERERERSLTSSYEGSGSGVGACSMRAAAPPSSAFVWGQPRMQVWSCSAGAAHSDAATYKLPCKASPDSQPASQRPPDARALTAQSKVHRTAATTQLDQTQTPCLHACGAVPVGLHVTTPAHAWNPIPVGLHVTTPAHAWNPMPVGPRATTPAHAWNPIPVGPRVTTPA